jgi:SAM-dependent methyltransferase
MNSPFGTDEMAAGYATSRPAVHPRVIDQVWQSLGRSRPFRRALDIGCGAGLSTRALEGFAEQCIGVEPAEAMLQWTSAIAPRADFVVGTAEALPVCDRSIEVITAAGSLNYVNLDLFFPEAARVLVPQGILVVYDFLPGRSFPRGTELDEWFSGFMLRFPPPSKEARELNPEILAQFESGFRVRSFQYFEVGIPLTCDFYLDYMMTETNVAAAVRNGVRHSEIRSWCAETLAAVWGASEREVLFRGYFACLAMA